MKYRHVVIRQFGGPEVLQVVEDDLAALRSGQALVKVLAADVGFSDVNIRRGRYPRGPRPPFTPGYAMAGVVDQLGPDTAGLEMYGTASKAKHALVSRLGAVPIDYHTEDFVERVRALTDGAGVDAVFDPMGSAHLKLSARAVRKGGTIVAFGYYQAANRGTGALRDVLSQYMRLWLWSLPPGRKHVAFYDTRPMKRKHPDWYRDDLARLFALLAAGEVKPVIADRLPLEEAVTAHRRLEQADVQGRLVLTPNP